MMGEYVNIIFMCAMISLLFFGGWNPGFDTDLIALGSWPVWLANLFFFGVLATKIVFWFFMFAMVKGFVPRYRYDQLMRLGWKIFLPTSLVAVVIVSAWRVFGVGS